jgi:Ulp1 protease family, C-terminal catalytic domain
MFQVPQQMNNVDCGCFILEFMERFFVTSPLDDFRLPLDLSNWFTPEIVFRKRRDIANVIKNKMDSSLVNELPELSFYGDSQEMNNFVEYNGNDANDNDNNNEEAFNNNNDNYFPDNHIQQHIQRTENVFDSIDETNQSQLKNTDEQKSTTSTKIDVTSFSRQDSSMINNEIIAENENNSNTESMIKSIEMLNSTVASMNDSQEIAEIHLSPCEDPLRLETLREIEECRTENSDSYDIMMENTNDETSIVISD